MLGGSCHTKKYIISQAPFFGKKTPQEQALVANLRAQTGIYQPEDKYHGDSLMQQEFLQRRSREGLILGKLSPSPLVVYIAASHCTSCWIKSSSSRVQKNTAEIDIKDKRKIPFQLFG